MDHIEDPAIILAGGLGLRLRPVVSDAPKAMAPVQGKPFLAHLLENLKRQEVKDVIISVGYKKEFIKNHFGGSYGPVRIRYSEEDTPLGTGGALRKALRMVKDGAFVLNGDTFFDIDLCALQSAHRESGADITIALTAVTGDRYGVVSVGEGVFSNGGIYYLHKNIFDGIEVLEPFSFEKDVIEKHKDTLDIRGVVFDGYFIDIGVPEDYAQAQKKFS